MVARSIAIPLSIPLTGISANDVVPGVYTEVNFAQGAGSLGTATYAAILVGNKSVAGDATPDTSIYGPYPGTPFPLNSVQDAINRFGQGSELHRMYRRFIAANQVTPIFAIAVTASAGTAATQVITFTVTATANGSVRIYMGDEFVDSPISSGDTPTVVATNAASAINSKLDWPVTASFTLGVLTTTAKVPGLRGNWLRGCAVIQGSGVGTTSSLSVQTFFTGGTTADSSTTALATILPFRYYYVISAAEDATQFGALATQVASQALPTTGLRGRCIAGSIDTSGAATTIATGINSPRAEIVWGQNLDWPPAEIAAGVAAAYSLLEIPIAFRCNFDSLGTQASDQAFWKIPAPRSNTSPTRATIKAALNNGLSPIGVNANGTTYLVKGITTKSLTGANNDYRIRDRHKVTICDRFADDWISKASAQFSGKNVADDPPIGARPLAPNVVSPRVVKTALQKLEQDYGDLGLVQNVPAVQQDTIVIRELGSPTRISSRVPLQTVDILDQITTAVDQTAAFLLVSAAALLAWSQHFV